MLVLSIETAFYGQSSVALIEDEPNNVLEQRMIPGGRTQGEVLMPLIADLLESQKKKVSNLNAILVDIGPGSFTGVRIGLASAQGLAIAHQIPILGVSSLECLCRMAHDWIHQEKEREENFRICPMVDARKNEIYTALFSLKHHRLQIEIDETNTSLDQWLEKLNQHLTKDHCLIFVGEGFEIYQDQINQFSKKAICPIRPTKEKSFPHPRHMATLCWPKIMDQQFPPLKDVHPKYLRPIFNEFKRPSRR